METRYPYVETDWGKTEGGTAYGPVPKSRAAGEKRLATFFGKLEGALCFLRLFKGTVCKLYSLLKSHRGDRVSETAKAPDAAAAAF